MSSDGKNAAIGIFIAALLALLALAAVGYFFGYWDAPPAS